MGTLMKARTSPHELPSQSLRLPALLRAVMGRMIETRQAKADRMVHEQLARLGLQAPRHRGSTAFATTGGAA